MRAFFVLVLFTGCVMNNPLLLSSPTHYQIPTSITPCLSVPDPGFHPYLGLSAGMTNNTTSEIFFSTDTRSFLSKNLSLDAGLLFQPDLRKDYAIGFLGALNANGMYSSCSIDWNGIDITELPQGEKDLMSEKSSDFTSEINARVGVVGKIKMITLAAYVCGFTDYETGEYYNYRKKIDGIEYFYNKSSKQVSCGYGLGFDLSLGEIDRYDFGINYEIRSLYARSQTYKSSEESHDTSGSAAYSVITADGGVEMTWDQMKIEPYVDYEHIRISCALNANNITFCATYRW
jgi:hypothetical protein